MRRFLVTAIALGMASQLHAKEGNPLRNTRGSAGTTQQVVVDSGEPSRGSARRTNQESCKDRDSRLSGSYPTSAPAADLRYSQSGAGELPLQRCRLNCI